MTDSQRMSCHSIIHGASIAAAGAGAGIAQIPMSDNAVIMPIQLAMTFSLAKVFGVKLSEATAVALLTTATTKFAGRALSQVLFGWIWGFGNIINAATAAGVTEAAGWIIANQFYKDSLAQQAA